jgi:hypothetical protein
VAQAAQILSSGQDDGPDGAWSVAGTERVANQAKKAWQS